MLEFQRWLAVPEVARTSRSTPSEERLFAAVGCADCHRPSLPVVYSNGEGRETRGTIAPYTDLLLHDLGPGLADVDLSHEPAATRWRTAPLWGISYSSRPQSTPTLLHDGRARSIEEAILWHDGEARAARESFIGLAAPERQRLLAWIATL